MDASITDIGSAIGQIASALISLGGFYFVWTQIKQTNKNLRQSNHTAIYSINTEIYKFFAEHSDLRPYFHEGKPLQKDDVNRNKIFSLSELLADFFEYILVEKDSLAQEISEPWKNYIRKIYIKSSAFREFIHTNKDQYSGELMDFFAETCFTITDLIFTVRPLQQQQEFNDLDQIYQLSFGESSVPSETQQKWWEANPQGIIGLFSHQQIVGGVSFWPLTAQAFDRFRSGQLMERDIKPIDFAKGQQNNYYISDIVIKEEFRQKLYSNLLLRNLLDHIEQHADHHAEINVLALAYSDPGNKLLTRLGFIKIRNKTETLDKQDLFLLSLDSTNDIKQLKKALL